MLKRFSLALGLTFLISYVALALPFGHGGGAVSSVGTTAMQAAFNGASTDTWFDASATVPTNSTINSVKWNCTTTCTPSTAPTLAALSGSFPAMVEQWVGGMQDTDNHKFIVGPGGGHNANNSSWCGNDMYGWDTQTMQWSRLNAPSSLSTPSAYNCLTGGTQYSDGQPVGAHTYTNQTCVPTVGCLFNTDCGAQTGGCDTNLYKINTASLNPANFSTWSVINSSSPAGGFDSQFVFDSSNNKLYAAVHTTALFAIPSPYTGSWAQQGNGLSQQLGFHNTPAIKPGAFLVSVGGAGDSGGNTGLNVWDLTTGNISTRSFSGDTTIPNANAPGFVYDTADTYVGWNGGRTLYVLKLSGGTWTFTTHSMTGSNPTCSVGNCSGINGVQGNGTFTRFTRIDIGGGNRVFCIVANSISDPTFCAKVGVL